MKTMKKFNLILLLFVTLCMGSCFKGSNKCTLSESSSVATATEIAFIQNYLSTTGSTDFTQHPSGVFYKITNPGNGYNPNLCSTVLVKYDAFRLGYTTTFDSNQSASGVPFTLGSLIVGVQKVLQLVKAGGSVTIYIPPSLGYGSQDIRDANGNTILPGNSYLKFDFSLIAVQ
jgi:FKBP-type peptidyl-prolyl cis-trans isomerase FkpA